jgi:hypothetical protein
MEERCIQGFGRISEPKRQLDYIKEELTRGGHQWQAIINMAMNFQVP